MRKHATMTLALLPLRRLRSRVALSLAWLLLAALLLAAGGWRPAAGEPLRAWPQREVQASWWLDAQGGAAVGDAQRAFDEGRGRRVDAGRPLPLGEGRAVWIRLQLPELEVPVRAALAVPFPGMDRVDLFRPEGEGGWLQMRAGDAVPVADWPNPFLYPVFNFTLSPGEARPTYLRLTHGHPVALTWELHDAAGFQESSKGWHLVLGATLGFMALLTLLGVFNAWIWRDTVHLYYAVHVLLVGLGVMANTGLAGEYLWPRNPWLNDILAVVLPAAALGWMGLLVRELVAERGGRWLSRSLVALAAVAFGLAVGLLLLGRAQLFLPFNLFALGALAWLLAVLSWYAHKRPVVGLWILAGFATIAAATVLPLLRNLGLLPVTLATQYGVLMAWPLEILLMLAGLHFRSRERRDHRMRLGAMGRTDPLTGLASPRVLQQRLRRLLQPTAGGATAGAVLRVRVGNFEEIRSEFGREFAEAALLRAAACVLRQAREQDVVAREPGGDLVLLMAGEVSRQQASEAGRDIIAAGLKFSVRLPPGVTLSLQVAGDHAPWRTGDPQDVLAALDGLLQEIAAEPGGRKLRMRPHPEVSQRPGAIVTPLPRRPLRTAALGDPSV